MNEFTSTNFYKYASKGKLMGNRCKKCSEPMLPPRMVCIKCGSTDLEWIEFKGTGKLETFTVIHVAPSRLSNKSPYIVGIVKLDEGCSITARITDLNPEKPENIQLGTKLKFNPLTEKNKLIIAFKPV